ncbi:MAG: hypothetical protein IJX67_02990 [Oscillospiraceae bacterium]|nr:hypothetical protein [Oscillospiraceae bacterium]MBQ9167360.1 hypothetical protein [Oscillospiraceae bacterium]
MNETKEKRRFKKAFLIMSSILLTFGIMAQILSEMMGYTPLLADYFLHLLPSVAAGFLGYYLMTRLRNGGKTGKVILAVFLIIVFAWSAFMIVMFADVQFDDYYQDETYGNGWYFGWANRKEEAQYMLSKCHLFGHGDAYYQYSDDLIDPEVWIIDDLPQDVQNAMMERDRAEIFRHFRWDLLLPVLSYMYGFWITILFAVITVGWCMAAIGAFRKLNAWWEKILYAVCGVLIAEQLIFPLLGGLGIIACLTPHPFSMDWQVTLLTVIPQISVMLALMKSSRPPNSVIETISEEGEYVDGDYC